MGPATVQWYKERGLTREVTVVLTEEDRAVRYRAKKAGDTMTYDEITVTYCCGRIDVRRSDGTEDELALAPMLAEDWASFTEWLETFETDDVWTVDQLVSMYENINGKITWWEYAY